MPRIETPSRPDEYFMQQALREARKALQAGEVPVGAVVVSEGRVVGRGHNRVETRKDATQHAEIIALRQAARRQGGWRLEGAHLYVTLEPCAMCAGAITWSRVAKVVYGAQDPKAGACGSVLSVLGNPRLNHRPLIETGVLARESSRLLRGFFKRLRRSRARKKKANV
ncbi:MAG: tRNA adenosine(34) deaminase TadA [candidate division FCPU426 bacterium]